MSEVNLRDYVRDIPDFPKPGILFKDITPLLSSPLASWVTGQNLVVDGGQVLRG